MVTDYCCERGNIKTLRINQHNCDHPKDGTGCDHVSNFLLFFGTPGAISPIASISDTGAEIQLNNLILLIVFSRHPRCHFSDGCDAEWDVCCVLGWEHTIRLNGNNLTHFNAWTASVQWWYVRGVAPWCYIAHRMSKEPTAYGTSYSSIVARCGST